VLVRLRPATLARLAAAYGGELIGLGRSQLGRFVPLQEAHVGDLAPLLTLRFLAQGREALSRGASLLVDAKLRSSISDLAPTGATIWFHPHASWAMAKVLLDHVDIPEPPPVVGPDSIVGANVTLAERVVIGSRVTIGASTVIGSPGFGWAVGPEGERLAIPQYGGVIIEDDVWVGPLVTIDAGTLGPTILRRGVKLDAHVHVGHNCEIGEDTLVAAQSGFAGSVKIGKRGLIGGQVGIADHVTVGDDVRIAAKSGVIGDVPGGEIVAGYPAVPRKKWLRGVAALYRSWKEPAD
jgi:UDP-3-O-[3-hydroxymyristoyl] glucosamine N-acyltransferase